MNSSEWFLSSPIVAPSDSTQEDNELIELALDIQVPLPTHILDQQLDAVDSEAHKHSDGEDSASSQCLNTQEQGDAETKEEHEIEMICEGWHQQGYRLLRTGIAAPDDTKSFQGTFATSPAGVNLKLFDYQLHALNRILQMFRRNLGALLAYDMGLGKTLIVIGEKAKKNNIGSRAKTFSLALLVVFRDHPAAIYDQFEAEAQHHKPPHSPDRFSKDRLSVKVTHQIFRGKALIVVPFGLLPHWKAELEDRSHPPLKVLVYRKYVENALILVN
jgi:SNF2 family DNA or RNA helicase